MSAEIAKPWALMRHHKGWADIFRVESETADAVTGFYPDREPGEHVTHTTYAVLARFQTLEAAKAARERGLAERRKHDAAVDQAHAALKAAEKAQEDAWVAGLRASAEAD
ncbi:MAG TPA: hypothetical protein VFE03_07600 [Caulobacteraceae bacterium]|jgi:hypothetical protein|nr:hypothetical protein [Caulobacteraceae bacterium]